MLLAQSLLLAWLLSLWLPRHRLWLAVALGLCAQIPIPVAGLSFAVALRGLWGDPSVTTLGLLVLGLAGRPPAAFTHGWRAPTAIAAFSLLFYPLALGAGDFDPWRLGFQPAPLLAVLALPALWLWRRGQPLWFWLLLIDFIAFAAGLLESSNLWDYLIDPLLALASMVLAVRNIMFRQRFPRII